MSHYRGAARAAGLVALAAAVTLGACRGESPADAMRVIPAEANVVVRVDVKRLRGTPLHQRILAWLNRNDYFLWKVENIAKKSGLDVRRDVDALVLGAAGPVAEDGRAEYAIVAVGRFDRARVVSWYQDWVRGEGGEPKEQRHGQYVFYSGKDGSTNLAVPTSRLLLVGSKAWMPKMLDLAARKGQDLRSRPDMSGLLAQTAAPRIAWVVAHVTEAQRHSLAATELPLRSLTAVVASVDSSEKLGLELELRTSHTAPAEAKALADKLRGMIDEARRSDAVARAGLSAVLQAVVAAADGATFRADARLSKAQFDDLVNGVQNLASAPLMEGLRGAVPAGPGGRLGGPLGGPLGGLGTTPGLPSMPRPAGRTRPPGASQPSAP